ncbi:MAG: endonuclease VIII [Clostridia bacterium]|nr:endonuclease VIII [Clostridia bacterium]
MIELPEASVLAQQIRSTLKGKTISRVTMAQSPHKFAWYLGDPQGYHSLLAGRTIENAAGYGGLVEIQAEGAALLFGDGVSLRYMTADETLPSKHQLHIEFDDESHLFGSVQMYGGLWAFEGEYDNPYYAGAKEKPHPLSEAFSEAYFAGLMDNSSDKLSLKAFLATEQRVPGLGNGVLQDILFNAGMHPKKKLSTLTGEDRRILYSAVKTTLGEMTFLGGRDTERDLGGCLGGYKTILSKNTVDKPCPSCGGTIKKEAYMGGSIYYCGTCQKL